MARLTHEAQPIEQQQPGMNERHVERLDRRAILLRDQRIHDVVDGIVPLDAVGEALEAELGAARKVRRRVRELPGHEVARHRPLVVAEDGVQAWVHAAQAGDDFAVVEGELLHDAQDHLCGHGGRDERELRLDGDALGVHVGGVLEVAIWWS